MSKTLTIYIASACFQSVFTSCCTEYINTISKGRTSRELALDKGITEKPNPYSQITDLNGPSGTLVFLSTWCYCVFFVDLVVMENFDVSFVGNTTLLLLSLTEFSVVLLVIFLLVLLVL